MLQEYETAIVSNYIEQFLLDCCFVFFNFWATFHPTDEIHYLISHHNTCIEVGIFGTRFFPNRIGGDWKRHMVRI
jgi:hypothetical protein